MSKFAIFVALALTLAMPAAVMAQTDDDLHGALRTLRAVGPQGAGSEAAAKAWAEVASADPARLPEVLAALEGANPLAANWIRTAVDAIAQRAAKEGGKLPAVELNRFVLDEGHGSAARQLAFELLAAADPDAPARLLPGMLDDPCPVLRRAAVERVADEAAALAAAGKKEESLAALRKAFAASREGDQARSLADRLRAAGEKVDLPRHFGFVMAWKIIGPLDNVGGKGFAAVYPPEEKIDLAASYQGKHGTVGWKDFRSEDENGLIDLNKACGEEKGVAAYALSEFHSEKARKIEIRYATFSAAKLWLNGKLIDQRHVYHGGSEFDQYVARGELLPGRNVILVKACQNEQTQDWARVWGFRLRVCDDRGAAILSTREGDVPAEPKVSGL